MSDRAIKRLMASPEYQALSPQQQAKVNSVMGLAAVDGVAMDQVLRGVLLAAIGATLRADRGFNTMTDGQLYQDPTTLKLLLYSQNLVFEIDAKILGKAEDIPAEQWGPLWLDTEDQGL